MNVFSLIDWHANLRPHDVAVIHRNGSTTFVELRTVLTQAAELLDAKGIRRGETCAIFVEDPWAHLIAALALMLNGVRTISAHETFEPLPNALKIGFSLHDRVTAEPTLPGTSVALRPDDLKLSGTHRGLPPAPGFDDMHATCRIFGSSGTTGSPKAIGHSTYNLNYTVMERLARESAFLGAGPTLSFMGLSSIGGFTNALGALWAGVPLVLPPDMRWALRAINLYRIKTLLASPAQLQQLVGVLQGQGARFPSLERIYFGGSALPPKVALAVRVLLCPNITNSYGATEICGGAAVANGALLVRLPGAAGRAVPGVQIRITDESGNELPAGREGTVRLKAPAMCDGYIEDAEATAECFRDGWFLPGDLGKMSADGILTITGRSNEVVNLGGVKVNPREIDDFLLSQPEVQDAAAYTLPGALGVMQLHAAVVMDSTGSTADLLARCKKQFAHKSPTHIVAVDRIPRNTMGKALRRELAQAHPAS